MPHDEPRAQGVVILGLPPRIGHETPSTDDELFGQLLSVDPGLVGFFLVAAADHDADGLTSARSAARQDRWNVAVMDPNGTHSRSSSPGLLVCPVGEEPHFVDLGLLPAAVDPLEIALDIMRPDLVVAGFCDRPWPTYHHPKLVSVREGIALASLHLRRRGAFVLQASRGSTLRTDKASFYRAGARALVPALRTCHDVWKLARLSNLNDVQSQGTEDLLRIGSLLTTVEQRLLRTLQARDRLRWGTDYVSGNEDDVHLDLDSVLVELQGAVDAAVRAIHLAGGLGPRKVFKANWRTQDWVDALRDRWPRLASVYSEDENMRDAVSLLADFRNRIHSESWGYVRNGCAYHARHEMEIWIRCDDQKVPKFRAAMKRLGGRERWRWTDINRTCMFLDPVSLVEELVSQISTFLDVTLMQMAIDWQEDLQSEHISSAPVPGEGQAASAEWSKEREAATVLSQLGVREPAIRERA